MKILLVYPAAFAGGRGTAFPMPPLTVFHLAGIARALGHEVRVLEPSRYAHALKSEAALASALDGVDVIGLSCTTLNWPEATCFATAARRLRPGVTVVAGGVHASRYDAHAVRCGTADVVLRGEADRSWPRLLDALAHGDAPDGVPGATWLRDGSLARTDPAPLLAPAEIAALPGPAYDLVPLGTYAVLPIETSRGCPQHCGFCSITHHASWRGAPPESVVERLRRAAAEHRARFTSAGVCLVDDCFTARPAHVRAVCEGLAAAGDAPPLMIEARVVDLLRDDVLGAIAGVPVMEIQVGVECGYDDGLRRIGKGITVEQVRECARRLSARGLAPRTLFSLIVGLPWEGEDECRRTIDLATELSLEHDGAVNLSWWLPLPSTLWDARATWGIAEDDALYDRAGWLQDGEAFARTHPRLGLAGAAAVRAHLNACRRRGAKIFGL